MQRTIYFIRHAKSSWADPGTADFDRPLNARGERDAPEMGRRLLSMGAVPELIIASTANRAAQTARLLAAAMQYPESDIRWEKQLYHCSPETFYEVLEGVAPDIKSVAFVAHNPGITAAADALDDRFRTGDMPTCAVVGATGTSDAWADFPAAQKTVFLYEYPKKNQEKQ